MFPAQEYGTTMEKKRSGNLMYAQIYWLTTEDGGRKNPILPNPEKVLDYYALNGEIDPRVGVGSDFFAQNKGLTYCANTQIKNNSTWSVCVYFENSDGMKLGTMGKYWLEFLAEPAKTYFQPGDIIHICEGAHVVGRGVML